MGLKESQIRNGFCYVTANAQHRVVLRIENGRVHHVCRGKTPVKPKQWQLGHTKANPPTLRKFAEAVAKRIIPRPTDATNAANYWRKYT